MGNLARVATCTDLLNSPAHQWPERAQSCSESGPANARSIQQDRAPVPMSSACPHEFRVAREFRFLLEVAMGGTMIGPVDDRQL